MNVKYYKKDVMDNKALNQRDRGKLAANEEYEVRYAAEKFGVSEQEVREAR